MVPCSIPNTASGDDLSIALIYCLWEIVYTAIRNRCQLTLSCFRTPAFRSSYICCNPAIDTWSVSIYLLCLSGLVTRMKLWPLIRWIVSVLSQPVDPTVRFVCGKSQKNPTLLSMDTGKKKLVHFVLLPLTPIKDYSVNSILLLLWFMEIDEVFLSLITIIKGMVLGWGGELMEGDSALYCSQNPPPSLVDAFLVVCQWYLSWFMQSAWRWFGLELSLLAVVILMLLLASWGCLM